MATEGTSVVTDFELNTMVGHLIRVTQQVHSSLWDEGIGDGHLTSPQFAVLHVLAHDEPLDQRTLGERASLDRTTVTGILSRLATRDLVERTFDPTDARRRLVALTPQGRVAHNAATVRADAINERLLDAINERERADLLRILSKIRDHHRG